MAKLTSVPFALQKGEAGITQNSDEKLLNMYAEIAVSGRSQIVRKQRACLRAVYAITGTKRCIEEHNGTHYAIIRDVFYSFDGTTLTTLGTIGTVAGRCTMVFNDNDEIMISDGVLLYWWNGSVLAAVTNPAAFVPGMLSYLNGYAIVNAVGSDVFYISPANDFSQIDALDFATAESSPDSLVGTFVDHNEIWLPGKKTIEIWQGVGGSDFPFQAVTTAKIERGVLAPLSMAAEDNTVTFLGNDKIVYRAEGYRPSRISTHAIETQLKRCTDAGLLNAYALIYTSGGHKFYTLTVPGEWTGQFDFATGLWSEAQTYGSADWTVMGSAGHDAAYVMTDAGIAELDDDVNTDEGNPVIRLGRSAPGDADGYLITMTEFMLDCEVGRAAMGVTPQVMLRVARDGETFGNIRTRSIGLTGEYGTRPFWRSLGQGRKPVIEFSVSGDFRFSVMKTLLNAEVDSA